MVLEPPARPEERIEECTLERQEDGTWGFDLDDEATEAAFFLEGSPGAMENDADNIEAKVEVGGSCPDKEEMVSSSDVHKRGKLMLGNGL